MANNQQLLNELNGLLFRNDKKETENQPDYTGKIMLNGTEMRLAAWKKQGKKGPFLSVRISEFQSNGTQPAGGASYGQAAGGRTQSRYNNRAGGRSNGSYGRKANAAPPAPRGEAYEEPGVGGEEDGDFLV